MCLEVMALRGKPAELRRFADHLIGLKGVQHGRLVISSAAWRPARRDRH
jgi:CopG family nickel-responsive transcriptional regulator